MVKDYERKTCLLIDMSMSIDNYISVKEYDEKIQRLGNRNWKKMEHLKTTNVSLIVGALGMNKIPGSPSQYERQEIALCRTVHLLRKVLSMWLKNITLKKAAKNINT